jgi:nicotinate-nucleotide pyrophosphorylase (carboxylating)
MEDFLLPRIYSADELMAQAIALALREDHGDGDHSALSCIPTETKGKARLLVKSQGILAGVKVAERVFHAVDEDLTVQNFMKDGEQMKHGDVALEVYGKVHSILRAERVVLNFMQRMSAIATLTAEYVELVAHSKAKILDTRKTTPGIRVFEKMAVGIGGGHNHRMGLYDMIMLKDNHIDYAGGVTQAIRSAKEYLNTTNRAIEIEVETRNMEEIEAVLREGGVRRIMLDNFTPQKAAAAVAHISGRVEVEASGGIDKSNVADYAEAGVDFISIGALTHSVHNLDLSLKAV